MTDLANKYSNNLRFFSDSSILKKQSDTMENKNSDPNPFGLEFQENYPDMNSSKEALTMGVSPTQSYNCSDTSMDIDYQF